MTVQMVSSLEDLKLISDKENKILAYPTESVFGLGCRVDRVDLIQEILDLKERKNDKGFVIIASDLQQLKGIVDLELLPPDLIALLDMVNYHIEESPYDMYSDIPGLDFRFSDLFNQAFDYSWDQLQNKLANPEEQKPLFMKASTGAKKSLATARQEVDLYNLVFAAYHGYFSNQLILEQLGDLNLEEQALKLATVLHNSGQGLTFLLPAHPDCPEIIRGKFATVAVRLTKEEFLVSLIETMGGALISTSANHSGSQSLTSAEQVEDMLVSDSRAYLQERVLLLNQPVIYPEEFGIKESILINLLPDSVMQVLKLRGGTVPETGIARNLPDLFLPNLGLDLEEPDQAICYALLRFLIAPEFTIFAVGTIYNYLADPDVEHNEEQLFALVKNLAYSFLGN